MLLRIVAQLMGEDVAGLVDRERLEQGYADIEMAATPAQAEQPGILLHGGIGLGDQRPRGPLGSS